MFVSWHNNYDCKFPCYYAEICHVLSEKIHSQYFSVFKSIYIEGVFIDHFSIFKPSTITMAKSHSHLLDESDKDVSTTSMNIRIIFWLLLSKSFAA